MECDGAAIGLGLVPSSFEHVHMFIGGASFSMLHIVIFIVARRCPKECTSACGVRASISSGAVGLARPACAPPSASWGRESSGSGTFRRGRAFLV